MQFPRTDSSSFCVGNFKVGIYPSVSLGALAFCAIVIGFPVYLVIRTYVPKLRYNIK